MRELTRKSKMVTWIVVAFYLAGIIAAVDAVMHTRTPQGAVAWSVSLVAAPFVAVPAYLVLGRSKFEGTNAAYQQRRQEIDSLVRQIQGNLRPWGVGGAERYGPYRAIREMTGMELTRGNHAELLVNGQATFDSILEGIAHASHYVLVQIGRASCRERV